MVKRIWKYARFTLFHSLTLPFMLGLTLGGHWIGLGLLMAVVCFVGGDLLAGDDNSEPVYHRPWLLDVLLYSSLPLLLLMYFLLIWLVAPNDLLGYGRWVQQLTGYDALAAREASSLWQLVLAVLSCGLLSALVGTVVGHELTHRTWHPLSMWIGRWLLAFSWDTAFAIEHVYGHHRYVGTAVDPATAPRGRNVYWHIVLSTIEGNRSAWQLEAQRLARKRQPRFSYHNRYLRGIGMSLSLTLLVFVAAGWVGVLTFTASALLAKAFLEIVNFMEHYGIVRDPATPVQPRHSWNTNKRASSWGMFNLTRHSHHHAEGDVPFYRLRPYPDAPLMINGYLSTLLLTLIPPLWQHLMLPRVMAWDQHYASAAELELASAANQRSGIARLQALDYTAMIAQRKLAEGLSSTTEVG